MESHHSDGLSSTGSEGCDGESAMSRGINSRDTPNRFPEDHYRKLHTDLLEKYQWTLQLEDLEACLTATASLFQEYER